MTDTYSLKHFQFQRLSNGLLSVTFKPICSRFDKKIHYCLFEPGTKYYDVAVRCMNGSDYWLEINWLALFVKKYDRQIIPAI